MGNEFIPNLNVADPLAEIIDAENTLREFGAASAAMEFGAEQNEAATEENAKAEEAHQLTEHEQLLQDRIAELEAQLAKQKALNSAGSTQATITSTGVNDDCPEIVDPEPLSDETSSVDANSLDGDDDSGEPDWSTLDNYLDGDEYGETAAAPDEPAAPTAPQAPMVTLQHRIPRASVNAWEPAKEDVITVKVPKANVFPNAAQPYTVAEDAIALPEGITGNYQIASTRPMLSENTVYVNWRRNTPTRPNTFF